jgi:hypothetical protein
LKIKKVSSIYAFRKGKMRQAARLNQLPLAEDRKLQADWRAAVIEWHLRGIAAARTEAWIFTACEMLHLMDIKELLQIPRHNLNPYN